MGRILRRLSGMASIVDEWACPVRKRSHQKKELKENILKSLKVAFTHRIALQS